MKKKSIIYGITSILIVEGVGLLSGFLAGNSREVYKTILKPALSPPGLVFPIVWTILYALMGVAAYLVCFSIVDLSKKYKALSLYTIQLFINFIWSIVFFRFQSFGIAIIVILILDIIVLFTIFSFYKVNKKAFYIMIPYFIWIVFATYLNIGIYILN